VRTTSKRVFKHYLIFYRVLAAHIEVLQIVHGSMDWQTRLSEPE
jgi:plasmid stabilization system protein ParE